MFVEKMHRSTHPQTDRHHSPKLRSNQGLGEASALGVVRISFDNLEGVCSELKVRQPEQESKD